MRPYRIRPPWPKLFRTEKGRTLGRTTMSKWSTCSESRTSDRLKPGLQTSESRRTDAAGERPRWVRERAEAHGILARDDVPGRHTITHYFVLQGRWNFGQVPAIKVTIAAWVFRLQG